MNIYKYIKNWRTEGDICYKSELNNIDKIGNNISDLESISGSVYENDISIEKSKKFFDRIAFFKLTNISKNDIAQGIADHSYPNKLYWIQLFLSCIIVALGLFMNSIPVIIGAMLISPLLDPIKTFAFAITNGNKTMYIRSIKTILLSILVAIVSSVFVSLIVPFSHITSEIMVRVSPNMLDLFVALFSGVVAFLSLGFKRLQENIAGVAIAVALLPPLSIVGIGIYFLDFSIAQGSFLLFFTNLAAILIVGIIIFYMFGFFPTNKSGKKRSLVILLMVIISVLLITIPLEKSMSKIADNMKITNQINEISISYLASINNKILLDKMSFHNLSDDVLRVSAVLNVPSDILITNENKDELAKLLSMQIQKSVELDLNIVEISSVYISKQETKEDILLSNINDILLNSFEDIFVLNYRVIDKSDIFVFLNLYTHKDINKDSVYDLILSELRNLYGDNSNLIIEWQTNGFVNKDKSQQELELEKQFYFLFSGSKLELLNLSNSSKVLSGDSQNYMLVDVKFQTPDNLYKTKERLLDWKVILEQSFDMEVNIKSNIQYFSEFEL